MPNFKVDPNGGPIDVDFHMNLPVFVITAFAVWKNGLVLAGAKPGKATPAGVADFTFGASVATPSTLVCQLDCLADAAYGGEELNVVITLRQNGHEEAFALEPVPLQPMASGDGAETRVKVKFGLVS